jgi:hypothetical protein
MRKGTPKEKAKFQYYKKVTEAGQTPKMYQEKMEEKRVIKKVRLDATVFRDSPGKFKDWLTHWEGEPDELWAERQRLRSYDWIRMIEGLETVKKVAVLQKYRFYIHLMEIGSSPRPVTRPEIGARLRTSEDREIEEAEGISRQVLTKWTTHVQEVLGRLRAEEREWRNHLKEEVTRRVTT